MTVRVKFDDREWKRGFKALGRKFPAAAKRSLKKAGVTGRAQVARDIRSDMKLKVGRIKEEVFIRVHPSSVELSASLRRIPLIEFGAKGPEPSRGKGRGVSFNTGKGRQRNASAFIATMRSGHRGVFKRIQQSRLPITELHGPSIGHVFRRKMPGVIPKVREALMKNLRHEFARALARR